MQPPRRSFARGWFAWLIVIPTVLAALALGVFFFALFSALLAVAALVVGVRLWWLRRRIRRAADSDAIEAEYEVVEERATSARKRP